MVNFHVPPGTGLMIVVAITSSPVRFTFHPDGRAVSSVVPPTYLHAAGTDRNVLATLEGLLAPVGYRVVPAVMPKKLLAARSCLAAYGRNNVTYVPGFGSFRWLAAFYSDLPCESDEWQEVTMLERCEQCRLCYKSCPTGAIASERFLVYAEQCITFHDEKSPAVPFAPLIEPAWHN